MEDGEGNMRACARGAAMLDAQISTYVDILQAVGQGCTLSPTLFGVLINDTIATQGQVGKETVSGLMFADGFCGDIRNARRLADTNREGARIH